MQDRPCLIQNSVVCQVWVPRGQGDAIAARPRSRWRKSIGKQHRMRMGAGATHEKKEKDPQDFVKQVWYLNIVGGWPIVA